LEAKATAPSPADGRDPLPLGRGALEPAVELALRYAAEQDLLPRYLDAEEVWEGLPPEMK
jgi:4,5-dihydroxyphthalate decarboxylase